MAEYAESTHHSQQPLRRFAHLRRFDRALELLQVAPDHSVLDLGAGDGYFLRMLADHAPGASLTAVEPDPNMQTRLRQALRTLIAANHVQVYADGDVLPDDSFDRLACLEVMEHLPPRLQQHALRLLDRVARPGARLVISVPVEIGPVALVKALARLRSGEPAEPWHYLLKALFGQSVPRPDSNYILTHTGFRFTDLESEISDSPWRVDSREFSPVPFGSWMINSQVIYVLKQRRAAHDRP